VELDEPEQSITARHGWQRADLPSLFNAYLLSDYLAPEVKYAWQRGETVVVHDVFADPRANGANCAALHFGAIIAVPLFHAGRWRFLLTIYNDVPRDWDEHEIALIQDLAERIWTAVERVRAEQALAASEAKYHALFESMDEAYCIIELLFDEAQQPFDVRYIEANQAFTKLSGLTDVIGKTIRELVPDIEPSWFSIYGRIARTREPERFEARSPTPSHQWEDLYAFPIGEPGANRVAVLFRDITERRRDEQLRKQQIRLLELIAAGAPLDESLEALCRAVSRISSGVRTSILLADATRKAFRRPIAPELLPSWGEGLDG